MELSESSDRDICVTSGSDVSDDSGNGNLETLVTFDRCNVYVTKVA